METPGEVNIMRGEGRQEIIMTDSFLKETVTETLVEAIMVEEEIAIGVTMKEETTVTTTATTKKHRVEVTVGLEEDQTLQTKADKAREETEAPVDQEIMILKGNRGIQMKNQFKFVSKKKLRRKKKFL